MGWKDLTSLSGSPLSLFPAFLSLCYGRISQKESVTTSQLGPEQKKRGKLISYVVRKGRGRRRFRRGRWPISPKRRVIHPSSVLISLSWEKPFLSCELRFMVMALLTKTLSHTHGIRRRPECPTERNELECKRLMTHGGKLFLEKWGISLTFMSTKRTTWLVVKSFMWKFSPHMLIWMSGLLLFSRDRKALSSSLLSPSPLPFRDI